ncbi:Hypothetical_protein [Hexamita inflata]|uniref:Hypothetical_protein n=1 Tax=Hexamita inflata TaxID=28002 RepID=A0AA86QYA6_9EUKA|nr:Hypothetical protein HINF_LOCUS54058 [Hexamita inflata]
MFLVLYSAQFSCKSSVLGVKISNKCPMVMECKSANCLYYSKTDIGHSACKQACYTSCFTSPSKTKKGIIELNGYYYCPNKAALISCCIIVPIFFVLLVVFLYVYVIRRSC